MSATDGPHQENSTDVMKQLAAIVSMPIQQQRAILGAWKSLSPDLFADSQHSNGSERHSMQDLAPQDGPGIDEWIQSLDGLSKREKYSQLHDALTDAAYKRTEFNNAGDAQSAQFADHQVAKLSDAMDALKKGDPIFSIEIAVVKLAYQRPWLIMLGLVGIGLALWRIFGHAVKFVTK